MQYIHGVLFSFFFPFQCPQNREGAFGQLTVTLRPSDEQEWEHLWGILRPSLIWKDVVMIHVSTANDKRKNRDCHLLASVPALLVLTRCISQFRIVS